MFNRLNLLKVIFKFYFPFRTKIINKLLNINNKNILFNDITQLEIGNHVLINSNFEIIGKGKVFIDDYTYTAANLTCITTTHNKFNMDMYTYNIHIEKLCWIGANVIILPNITIGEGSIIGAGSIVSKNIPPYSIVYGNPIKISSKREITFPYRLPGGKYFLHENNHIERI
jgi:acetyltransferase-like isoleucine patch superfamily enzyme